MVMEGLEDIGTEMRDSVAAKVTDLRVSLSENLSCYREKGQDGYMSAKLGCQDRYSIVTGRVKDWQEEITRSTNSVKEEMKQGVVDSKERVKDTLGNVRQQAQLTRDSFQERVSGKMESVWISLERVKGATGDVWESFSVTAGISATSISDRAQDLHDEFQNDFSSVKELLKEQSEEMGRETTENIDNFVTSIQDAAQEASSEVEAATDTING